MRKANPTLTAKRKRQILDAATQCFKENGFHSTSMATICKAAKMSPGHVYHYFPGKEDIIEAIIEENCQKVESNLGKMLEQSIPLEFFIEKTIEVWKSKEEMDSVLMAEIAAEGSRNPKILKMIQKRDQLIQHYIKLNIIASQRDGYMNQDVDPEAFATVFPQFILAISASIQTGQITNVESVNNAVEFIIRRTLAPDK